MCTVGQLSKQIMELLILLISYLERVLALKGLVTLLSIYRVVQTTEIGTTPNKLCQ